MRNKTKTFEVFYEDENMRLDSSLSRFISYFQFFFEYYGSDFTAGALDFLGKRPQGEKEYWLILTNRRLTLDAAPRVDFYISSSGELKNSYEISIPYRCPNSLAKNLIAFAVTLAGIDCVTDLQRQEIGNYVEFLNNSYTGKGPSDILEIGKDYKIFIYPKLHEHVIEVLRCDEMKKVNTAIRLEEYEDYTGCKMLSTCYEGKKALITGIVTSNIKKMPSGMLNVFSGGKNYRIVYSYIQFLDYLDCFEVGCECNFYGNLMYKDLWHEDDKFHYLVESYDGHMRLECVTRR